jgi:hypothetical protein
MLHNFCFFIIAAAPSHGRADDPDEADYIGTSIHLATAIIHGVDEFHTRDKSSKGSKISLLKLYESIGNPKVCGKYDLVIKSPESDQGVLI